MKQWKRRREDVVNVVRKGGVGIELGVAEGVFSERVLRKHRLSHLFSVDLWAGDRSHTVDEYKTALTRLLPFKEKSTVLRMSFDQALSLFNDQYFDFIYVDGYAHDPALTAHTLRSWWPKLKVGGILAGDDYHPHHQPHVDQINKFVSQYKLDPVLIDCHEPYSVWSEYPTWFAMKPIQLTGARVAIVGNSERLINSNYGKQIDDHDIVIRLNRAAPLFYDHYNIDKQWVEGTGTKTDVWAMWRADEYSHYQVDLDRYYRLQVASYYGSGEQRVENYDIAALQRLMDQHSIENPSTGLRVLDWVLQRDPASIDLYGFDFKSSATWTDPDRSLDRRCPHDWQHEQQIINEIIDKNQNKLSIKLH